MKTSIRRKMIFAVVLNFLCITALLVSVSILSISDVLDDDSSEILRLILIPNRSIDKADR